MVVSQEAKPGYLSKNGLDPTRQDPILYDTFLESPRSPEYESGVY